MRLRSRSHWKKIKKEFNFDDIAKFKLNTEILLIFLVVKLVVDDEVEVEKSFIS